MDEAAHLRTALADVIQAATIDPSLLNVAATCATADAGSDPRLRRARLEAPIPGGRGVEECQAAWLAIATGLYHQ